MKKKQITNPRPNAALRIAYLRKLDRLINEMAASYQYWVGAVFRNNEPEIAQDAAPARKAQQRLNELKNRWDKRFSEMAALFSTKFVEDVAKQVTFSFERSLESAGMAIKFKSNPASRDVIAASIEENVALIKSIPQQYHLRVQGDVMRAYQSGKDWAQLNKALQAGYGITKRRAKLITRDQSAKLTGAMVKVRQQDAGIVEATWQHSGGGKHPRPDHLAASGKPFKVSEGCLISGEYIQPGEKINCRCYSRSILPF